jgi:DNA helicase II / ATP-dependent DNA helicase PcrA
METKHMELSKQQLDVIRWAKEGTGSLNLNAFAGCGKTTTLLELTRHLIGDVFLGAYNKKIADELQFKLKRMGNPKAFASTLHSAGYGAWRRVAPNVKVKGDKVFDIIQEKLPPEVTKPYGGFIKKAVSLAKQRAFGALCSIDDTTQWYDMIDHFGLEEDLPDRDGSIVNIDPLVDEAIRIYKLSVDQDYEFVDFDDMILAPLIHNVKMVSKDWVLIDEAQDTNPARRALAIKLLKPVTGRLVAVGDRNQAIYGFTGADSDSMDQIKEQLNSFELPLSVTYRCPKKIVALAQTWVPDITAAGTAPEGAVERIDYQTFLSKNLAIDDIILCRLTRPLIEVAYGLLRRGVGCRVEGREIGTGMIKLARRWKLTSISALVTRLEEYKDRECQKWIVKGREDKAAVVEDQVDTLLILCERMMMEGKSSINELVSFIDSIFGDTKEGEKQRVVTLSTIHKAKGREWNKVWLLGRNIFMPSRWARKDWQMQQEINLMYVAVTRAKECLIDVDMEPLLPTRVR